MISLAREWTLLSKELYGEEFIDELANLLRNNQVKTILECGCGDGYILHGLAERGFSGLGIDINSEMIQFALKKNQHPNIRYKKLDWLNLAQIKEYFNCVMCRGNSLSYSISWDKDNKEFQPKKAQGSIKESIGLMMNRIKKGGIFYVDTISQNEIDKSGGNIEIKTNSIDLKGIILYDWQDRRRYTFGGGKIGNERFYGGNTSYLMKPKELERIIKKHKPIKIWTPKLKHEKIYHPICAKI